MGSIFTLEFAANTAGTANKLRNSRERSQRSQKKRKTVLSHHLGPAPFLKPGPFFVFFALFCGYSFPGFMGGSVAPCQTGRTSTFGKVL